jgi:hypothetical protein
MFARANIRGLCVPLIAVLPFYQPVPTKRLR